MNNNIEDKINIILTVGRIGTKQKNNLQLLMVSPYVSIIS